MHQKLDFLKEFKNTVNMSVLPPAPEGVAKTLFFPMPAMLPEMTAILSVMVCSITNQSS